MGKISESVLRRSVFRLIHQKDGSIQKKHDAVITADHAVTNAVSDVAPVSHRYQECRTASACVV